MDRRQFLHAGSAATALFAAPAPAQTPPNRSSVMLWTLKGAFDQKLEIAARAGLESVELVDEHLTWSDAQIAEKKRLARSLHLAMDTLIAQPSWKTRPVSMVRPEQ